MFSPRSIPGWTTKTAHIGKMDISSGHKVRRVYQSRAGDVVGSVGSPNSNCSIPSLHQACKPSAHLVPSMGTSISEHTGTTPPCQPCMNSIFPSTQAHFKHLVASCASLHSNPHTRAPHFLHLILPQYPQLSQNWRSGGAPAGGGAAWLAAYDNGGEESNVSSSFGSSGGGIRSSTERSASSLKWLLSSWCAVLGPGVVSTGVAGVASPDADVKMLCLLLALTAPLATVPAILEVVAVNCPSCASSSSSQCLICL